MLCYVLFAASFLALVGGVGVGVWGGLVLLDRLLRIQTGKFKV